MFLKKHGIYFWVILLGVIFAAIVWARSHRGFNVIVIWIIVCFCAAMASLLEDRRLKQSRVASPVLFTALILIIGETPYLHSNDKESMLFFLCLYSIIYFSLFIFKSIAYAATDKTNVTSTYIVSQIIMTAGSGVIVFAATYTELFRLNQGLFAGANIGTVWLEQFGTFLYFTVVTFATVGYGDIHPVALMTRMLATLEIVFAFVVVGYSISMFSHIYEVFKKNLGNGKHLFNGRGKSGILRHSKKDGDNDAKK